MLHRICFDRIQSIKYTFHAHYYLALGSRGDIHHLPTLGRGLKVAGHQVRFITFESFHSLIAEHGLISILFRNMLRPVARGGADMPGLIRSFGSFAEGYARIYPLRIRVRPTCYQPITSRVIWF